MTLRNAERKYGWYVCGKCKHEIYRLIGDEDIIPCNECGAIYTAAANNAITGGTLSKIKDWIHKSRDQHDIPSQIKLDLTNL